MLNWGFLYFPEDKALYIPAILKLIVLLLIVTIVFNALRKFSNKQAAEAKKLEDRALRERAEKEHQESQQKAEG